MTTENIENNVTADYIAPAIRHLAVPIDSIMPDPSNVRVHPERNIQTIRASLRRFKQQVPILIDGNRIIRKGNGTFESAKLEGWKFIAVVQTDLEGSEATSFAIADNRASDTSQFDPDALAQQLQSLSPTEADLTSMGFSPSELAALLGQQTDTAQAQPPEDFPTVDESIETAHECPRCHYRWSGSSAPSQEAA